MAPAKKTAAKKSRPTGHKSSRPLHSSNTAQARAVQPPVARVVDSEEFTTEPTAPSNIPTGSVQLFVNGTDKGVVRTDGSSLSEFVTGQARNYGVRRFSVYLDGEKARTSMQTMRLDRVAKVEIVAKDARG